MAVPVSLGDSSFPSEISAGCTLPGDNSFKLVAPIESDMHS